jgi:iron complex outermembrane receptor protein
VPSPSYGLPGATHDDAPISIRATEYDIRRRGVIGSVSAHPGEHALTAGLWLEENDFVQARRYYGLDRTAPQRDYRDFQTAEFRTDWAYHFTTRTRQLYLQDAWRVSDDLTITAGFKSLSVSNHAATRAGPEKSGGIRAQRLFLPQVGFRLRLAPDAEVFGDYSRGMRAFSASNTSGPFATTQEAFDTIRKTLRPEVSDSFEVGWRMNADDLTLLATIYDVKFHNRLFSTPVGQGILGNPSAVANVGGVTAYGLEAAASWRASRTWSLYGSYAYNRATYDDDVYDGDGLRIAATRHNAAVDAPSHIFKGRVDYRRDGFYAHFGASYVSRRYFTFENDQSADPHFIADLSVGYDFSEPPWLDGLQAQINVTNLFDARHVSTVGSNDFPIRGDAQTLLASPPRQVFVALRKRF